MECVIANRTGEGEIEPDEKIVEIEMERLREFRNHPFKVKADAQMLQLIE